MWVNGDTEDQLKQSTDGPAAAGEIQTKNKKYYMPQKHYFLPEGKIKWPWVEYEEEKA